MKTAKTAKTKTVKSDVKAVEFRVWCDSCSIRIAPNEEQIAVDGKTYHQRCHSKTFEAVSRGEKKIFPSG